MLIQSIHRRSLSGVGLALQPCLFAIGLFVVIAALHRVDTVGTALNVAAVAVWTSLGCRLLPHRARAVTHWYRDHVASQGGEPDPPQPINAPSVMEFSEDARSRWVAGLEQDRLRWMAAPGLASRQALAVYGAWFLIAEIIRAFVLDHGSMGISVAVVALAAVALVLLVDLGRGRIRRARQPLAAQHGSWPSRWIVVWPSARVPGPIWAVLLLALVAAMYLVFMADSVSGGVARATALGPILVSLWPLRRRLDRIAGLEHTAMHVRLARGVVALAPVTWWVVTILQWLCFGAAMIGLWLVPFEDEFGAIALPFLGCGLMIASVRAEWRRPRNPSIVGAHDIRLMLTGTALEKRIETLGLVLGLAAAAWLFLQQL